MMKSDDAQVQYRKDMIELEHWRKKYDRILPDLEELEKQRKVEREAQAELVRMQRKTELCDWILSCKKCLMNSHDEE